MDEYTLKSGAKVAGILVTPEVYADIGELEGQFVCTEEKGPGGSNYIMRYLDYEYLSKMENLQTFVTLAAEARWMPHYADTNAFRTECTIPSMLLADQHKTYLLRGSRSDQSEPREVLV